MVGGSEAGSDVVSDEARPTRRETVNAGPGLLAQVLVRESMQRAWKRVKANKGASRHGWHGHRHDRALSGDRIAEHSECN